MKKFTAIILAMLIVLSFAACGGKAEPADTGTTGTDTGTTDPYEGLVKYTSDCGISVYMESGSSESTQEGFDCYIGGNTSAMTAVKEGKDIFDQANLSFDMPLEEYAGYVVSANGLTDNFSEDAYGNLGVSYEKTIDGNDFYYYCVVKKGTTAFWAITFMSMAADKDYYSEQFPLWAGSIEVE